MGNDKHMLYFIVYIINLMCPQIACTSPSSNCQTFMVSTCPNNKVTKWNKLNVGKHIKRWIKSVSIEYKTEVQPSSNTGCKALVMREMLFFSNFAQDAVSKYGIILGNIQPQSYQSYNQMFQQNPNPSTDNQLVTFEFQGPIWADLNNHFEWRFEHYPDKISAKLSSDAILRNGLYYGYLNNNELKIGK